MRVLSLAAIIFVLLVLTWACNDEPAPEAAEDESVATPAEAALAVVPVSPPADAAAVAGATPVRFVPAELPRLAEPEAGDPWAGRTLGPSQWRVFRVRDGGPPELLYETNRYIYGLTWAADGGTVAASFQSGLAAILVYDRRSAQTRTVRECGSWFVNGLEWLPDGRHLLVIAPRPGSYEGAQRSVTLLDVEQGGAVMLTDGLEDHGWAQPSPDGSRMLVRGHALRVFDAAGALLREIAVPDGFDVPAAAWSPDGRAFVYVVGPRGFFTL